MWVLWWSYALSLFIIYLVSWTSLIVIVVKISIVVKSTIVVGLIVRFGLNRNWLVMSYFLEWSFHGL